MRRLLSSTMAATTTRMQKPCGLRPHCRTHSLSGTKGTGAREPPCRRAPLEPKDQRSSSSTVTSTCLRSRFQGYSTCSPTTGPTSWSALSNGE